MAWSSAVVYMYSVARPNTVPGTSTPWTAPRCLEGYCMAVMVIATKGSYHCIKPVQNAHSMLYLRLNPLFCPLPPFCQQEDTETGGITQQDLWRVRVLWLFEATSLTLTRVRLQLFRLAPPRLRPWLFRLCGARYSPDSQVRVNDHHHPKTFVLTHELRPHLTVSIIIHNTEWTLSGDMASFPQRIYQGIEGLFVCYILRIALLLLSLRVVGERGVFSSPPRPYTSIAAAISRVSRPRLYHLSPYHTMVR